jgi:hypothetical protein
LNSGSIRQAAIQLHDGSSDFAIPLEETVLPGDKLNPRFELTPWANVDWDEFAGYPDAGPFQTRAWIEFLADVRRAEPVAAILFDGNEEIGRFTGLMENKLGLKILGSPLPGWTTPYMGFNLKNGVSRAAAARALIRLAFDDLDCIHLELRDRWLTAEDVAGLGFSRRDDVGYDDRTFEIDLRQPEERIFAGMASACRRCVRQSEKRGVTIEQAHGEAFAHEFYPQIRDVFLRQGLVPTYTVDRVRALIRHLEPTGQILLLRARDENGLCIATGIFPAFNDTALFWGGASLKEHQHNRPNEALHWHAIRYWRERGIARYDLGGFMEYKRKYGGAEIAIPGFRRSRSPLIAAVRTLAPKANRTKQLVFGKLSRGLTTASQPVALAGEAD